MIKRRDMLAQVLLFIITCGIYGVYWFYQTTLEMANLDRDTEAAAGWRVSGRCC